MLVRYRNTIFGMRFVHATWMLLYGTMIVRLSLYLLLLFLVTQNITSATTVEVFKELLNRLEDEVIEFSDVVQNLLSTTSSTINHSESPCHWLTDCIQSNYDHCISKFTSSVQCVDVPFNDPSIQPPCYKLYNDCSTRFDYTVSNVRIADDRTISNKTMYRIFESICRTRALDEWFVQYWNNATSRSTVPPRSMYFGSVDGMFRIFPARQSEDNDPGSGICKQYDPRVRPWYTAASSTSRNVLMLLDMSSTMKDNRLVNMKEATVRVITASTISDKIQVVSFDDQTSTTILNYTIANGSTPSPSFFPATMSNKNMLYEKVYNLTTTTSSSNISNYTSAFEKALDLISTGINDCSTAILLFTDNIRDSKGALESEYIQKKFADYEKESNNTILVFVYVMYKGKLDDYTFDCSGSKFHSGLWSKIFGLEEINNGLSTYFEIFQTEFDQRRQSSDNSLSTRRSEVAWVEPYPFHTFGDYGTTVSVPVYDKVTGQLLGVVGFENSLSNMKNARGYNESEILRRAKNKVDNDGCPNFSQLSPCSFQFHKSRIDKPNIICSDTTAMLENTTTATPFSPSNGTSGTEVCPNNVSMIATMMLRDLNNNTSWQQQECCTSLGIDCFDLNPETSKLWNNSNYLGMEYRDRGCCRHQGKSISGGDGGFVDSQLQSNEAESDQCIQSNNETVGTSTSPPQSNKNTVSPAGIVGIVLSSIALVVIAVFVYVRRYKFSHNTEPIPVQRNRPPPVPPFED